MSLERSNFDKILIKVFWRATNIKGILACDKKHTLPNQSRKFVRNLDSCAKKCSVNLIGRDSDDFWF